MTKPRKLEYREYMYDPDKDQWYSRPKGDLQNKQIRKLKNTPPTVGDILFYWCMANPKRWTRDRF